MFTWILNGVCQRIFFLFLLPVVNPQGFEELRQWILAKEVVFAGRQEDSPKSTNLRRKRKEGSPLLLKGVCG